MPSRIEIQTCIFLNFNFFPFYKYLGSKSRPKEKAQVPSTQYQFVRLDTYDTPISDSASQPFKIIPATQNEQNL